MRVKIFYSLFGFWIFFNIRDDTEVGIIEKVMPYRDKRINREMVNITINREPPILGIGMD